MAITTIPGVAEFGGTKANEYTVVDATKQLSAADYNALTTRVIAAFNAIGLDNGTTSGSLRALLGPSDGSLSGSAWAAIVALNGASKIQTVSGASGTVSDDVGIVLCTYTGGPVTLTAKAALAGRTMRIVRASSSVSVTVNRAGSDTIDGATSYAFAGTSAPVGLLVDFVCGSNGAWMSAIDALAAQSYLDLVAITSRVTALEAPTSVDTTADLSPGYSWTTAKRVHATDNSRTEACAVVLDSGVTTTTDWPVGESREFAKYNTSAYGLAIVMGASDTLNGGTAGTGSGVISGTTATPSATTPRPIVTVRRDSTTGWSWM